MLLRLHLNLLVCYFCCCVAGSTQPHGTGSRASHHSGHLPLAVTASQAAPARHRGSIGGAALVIEPDASMLEVQAAQADDSKGGSSSSLVRREDRGRASQHRGDYDPWPAAGEPEPEPAIAGDIGGAALELVDLDSSSPSSGIVPGFEDIPQQSSHSAGGARAGQGSLAAEDEEDDDGASGGARSSKVHGAKAHAQLETDAVFIPMSLAQQEQEESLAAHIVDDAHSAASASDDVVQSRVAEDAAGDADPATAATKEKGEVAAFEKHKAIEQDKNMDELLVREATTAGIQNGAKPSEVVSKELKDRPDNETSQELYAVWGFLAIGIIIASFVALCIVKTSTTKDKLELKMILNSIDYESLSTDADMTASFTENVKDALGHETFLSKEMLTVKFSALQKGSEGLVVEAVLKLPDHLDVDDMEEKLQGPEFAEAITQAMRKVHGITAVASGDIQVDSIEVIKHEEFQTFMIQAKELYGEELKPWINMIKLTIGWLIEQKDAYYKGKAAGDADPGAAPAATADPPAEETRGARAPPSVDS